MTSDLQSLLTELRDYGHGDETETLRDRAIKEIERLATENTYLRAALAHSDQPCAYCTLPAERWGECRSGFPGCARGDDAVGCPHFGAELKYMELVGELRPHIDAINTAEEDRAKWAVGHPERHGFSARMKDDHVIISMTAGDWYKIRGIVDGRP